MVQQNLSKLILEKDEDFLMEVTLKDPDTGLPIDISLATFTGAFNKVLDDTNGGTAIAITNLGSGVIQVSIPRATINSLDVKATYFFNVFMLLNSIQYKILNGSFTVAGRALAP